MSGGVEEGAEDSSAELLGTDEWKRREEEEERERSVVDGRRERKSNRGTGPPLRGSGHIGVIPPGISILLILGTNCYKEVTDHRSENRFGDG